VITKNAFILTASAIAETEMEDDVRIALVERLVKNFAPANAKFDANRFRFACKVYRCKICPEDSPTTVAGDIKKYWKHVFDAHPDYKDIVADREGVL